LISFTREIGGQISIILKYDRDSEEDNRQLEEIQRKTNLRQSVDAYFCVSIITYEPTIDEAGLLTEISSVRMISQYYV
jgi:tagatose-1,6-bisphosphate aldolase